MYERVKGRLAEVVSLWNTAERVIKQAEFINRKVCIPSINELRYAGRWIILVLKAVNAGEETVDESSTLEDGLSYAKLCCMQAKHDAIDSIVIFCHGKIHLVSDRYGHRVMSMFVKGYMDFLTEIDKVDNLISLSREERHNRSEIYEEIVTKHLPKLGEFMHAINTAEGVINEELEKERRSKFIEGSKFWISFAINVILALMSIYLGYKALPNLP